MISTLIIAGSVAGALAAVTAIVWAARQLRSSRSAVWVEETAAAPAPKAPSAPAVAVPVRETEVLERSKVIIHGLLLSVHESVESLVGEMSDYNNSLTAHKAAIKKAMTVAALQEVERLMIAEVDSMQRGTLRYRERLENAESTIRRQEEEMQRLNADATIDFLTRLPNRRTLDTRFSEEWARFKRYGGPFSVVMLDVDYFKRINDRLGHIAGDRILRAVAGVAQEQKRESDFLGRFGGEEFALLLPETPLKQAVAAAEKIRKKIEGSRFNYEGSAVTVTLSAGVAEAAKADRDAAALLARADAALYRAKEQGRNRVEAAPEA